MVTIIKKGTPKDEIKRQIDEVVPRTSPGDLMKYAGKIKLNIGKKRPLWHIKRN